MNRRQTKTLFVVAGLFIAVLTALNVLAYRHAHAMMRYSRGGNRTRAPESLTLRGKARVLFSGVNIPRPGGTLSMDDLEGEWCRMRIPIDGDVTLESWYCTAGGENRPLVILFHGYSASKESLLLEAAVFRSLGLSVMLVDFRGSGGSSESYTTFGVLEGEDVAAAVRHARRELSPSTLVLFGQSMGAAAVLRAIHCHGVEPDAVIIAAVFDTMCGTVRNRFRAMGVPSFPAARLLVFWGGVQNGFNGFAHRPVGYAASVSCPALFLHGADDPRARVSEARRVYDAVGARKRFVAFQGVGHESCARKCPDLWQDAVRTFVAGL